MKITRKMEFDAGHRIPFHDSKCRHFHGHRWVLEVTIEGEIRPIDEKDPGSGMLADFGRLKEIIHEAVVSKWDHAFLVWEHDSEALRALAEMGPYHRTVVLECLPTSENLANLAKKLIGELIDPVDGVTISRVRLYETPNCWADAT